MFEIKKENINLNDIDIDVHWNTAVSTEHKIHKIHKYPAKFPAFITQKAIEYAREENVEVNRIADIFCGCGTVAYEAKREGINFWGCDINPVAALIARVKSKKLESNSLQKYFSAIRQNFVEEKETFQAGIVNPRIIYWFNDRQIDELSLLKHSIMKVTESNKDYNDFFMCAFSNILKPTSKWLTKSIKPQVDPEKIPAEVLKCFVKQFDFMFQANNEAELYKDTEVEITVSNALELDISAEIDLIITSPPYVTSYEYADLHQLSLLWLEFTEDYRVFRKNTIGSSYTSEKRSSFLLNKIGKEIFEELTKKDKSKAESVQKYYLDMQKIADVSYESLKEQGISLFVIGNTEYKNVQIKNAEHLVLSLYESGFKKVFATKRKISGKILTPYRDDQGKFTSNTSGRKVYSEEYIIVGRK